MTRAVTQPLSETGENGEPRLSTTKLVLRLKIELRTSPLRRVMTVGEFRAI